MKTTIQQQIVDKKIEAQGLKNLSHATIGELRVLTDGIEKESGQAYIRMEMGIPGIKPAKIAVEAEIKALKNGIAGIYPHFQGLPQLKEETARFVKLFLEVGAVPQCCLPTVGSMNGAYTAFMVAGRRDKTKDTILSLDPGFPMHKQIVKMIGLKHEGFDVSYHRGEALKEKLESHLKKGNISTLLYSNPNNPTWICLTPAELKIIGELATRYDVVVVEDLAYFGMDFREDYFVPGKPPYQPTVAKYTENYILLVSSSKIFSYAGQRVSMLIVSETLYRTKHNDLLRYYATGGFGEAIASGTILLTTAGVAHSAQYALAAVIKAVNDGTYHLTGEIKQYGEKAAVIKKMFIQNGFKILYDMDDNQPVADGFYFTIFYPGMDENTLVRQMLYHGISAMSLTAAGSEKRGLRICVSLIDKTQYPELEKRLALFYENNKTGETGKETIP
ncbi:MAG: pyridoxal phosphate-dependent aminotransferase [bacterium]|nr:pyridoxal phosphate-dependent aminotransferase [bacterium]